jgi:hypothetical protein
MDSRSYQAGAIGTAPTAPASPSVGYPTNGNPGTGTPATQPGEYWFYQIGEEIRNVLVAAGVTPVLATLTQLRDSLLGAISFGTAGYIKFGSLFGGWIVQWNVVTVTSANTNQNYTLPLAFPNSFYGATGIHYWAATTMTAISSIAIGRSGLNTIILRSSLASSDVFYVAFGK